MLRTYCATHLPLITRLTPILTIRIIPATYRHFNTKSIFDPDDEEEKKVKKIQQLPDDKPWDGDEPVKHSVLRMIIDKYSAPLRVEGAARRAIPQPQSNYIPPPPQKDEKSATIKKMERESKLRELKQNRILDAKDAAYYYASERKYPTNETVTKSAIKKDIDWEDWDLEKIPRSINDMGPLGDEMIRSARARGCFDDLPGRGKPLEHDPLINNPFIDRTEYYLNRIVQRNGAAPPWVMMQQEVSTEISTIRSQMTKAVKRCVDDIKENNAGAVSKSSLVKRFESLEQSFFDKEVERINMRVRSYNVMCPAPVRKQLLELEKEIKSVFEKHKIK